MNANEITQQSKTPVHAVPKEGKSKDKKVSGTSREELSLPEFGGRRSLLAVPV